MRVAAGRYLSLGLFDHGRPMRILDLGCGCAYILAVCREMGHEVLGLDLDDEPLYNEMVDFLELPRIVHRVTPDDPLPPLDRSFDVISSFCTCFNFSADGSVWTAQEWVRAIDAFMGAVAPDGHLLIEFNRDRTGRLYPPELRRMLSRSHERRARFFGSFLEVRHADPAVVLARSSDRPLKEEGCALSATPGRAGRQARPVPQG
jgi:SAM-dependent methyltransferase